MSCDSCKRLDLIAEAGATWRHRLIVSDSNGTPIDFSASSAKMQVRTEPGGDLVVELTDGAGITLGATGEIDLRVEASEAWTVDDSTLLLIAQYVYDLLVTTGADTDRIVDGAMTVRPSITAPPP